MLELLAAAGEGAEPKAWGLDAGGWVALAMIAVLAIMWRAGVPRLVAGLLDARIAEIRKQLDEARALRDEAEKLRDDYAEKARAAEKDIAAMQAAAEKQASEIVEQAKQDAGALIERHKALAAGKIAAAERAAVDELRARAAEAAAAAAKDLIAEAHDPEADSRLVDKAISEI